MKPDRDTVDDINRNLKKLRVYSMIPDIAKALLEEDIQIVTYELGKKLVGSREFNGRSNMVSDLVKFFSNLSDLNNNDTTRPLFKRKKVGFGFLEICTNILNKNNEAT